VSGLGAWGRMASHLQVALCERPSGMSFIYAVIGVYVG